MSKYKAGDKVVMQIMQDDCYGDYKVGNETCSWYNSQEFFDKVTEPLSEYTEPLEVEASRLIKENAKLKAEIESAKAAGQQEAWELAQKIVLYERNGVYSVDELEEIFKIQYWIDVFLLTYSEVTAKVAEWEKAKEEICVGDVLLSNSTGNKCVITRIKQEEIEMLWNDSSYGKRPKDFVKGRFKKIGHIDIASMLEQIGD